MEMRVNDALGTRSGRVLGMNESEVLGGALKAKRKRKGAGNREWLALLEVPA